MNKMSNFEHSYPLVRLGALSPTYGWNACEAAKHISWNAHFSGSRIQIGMTSAERSDYKT